MLYNKIIYIYIYIHMVYVYIYIYIYNTYWPICTQILSPKSSRAPPAPSSTAWSFDTTPRPGPGIAAAWPSPGDLPWPKQRRPGRLQRASLYQKSWNDMVEMVKNWKTQHFWKIWIVMCLLCFLYIIHLFIYSFSWIFLVYENYEWKPIYYS